MDYLFGVTNGEREKRVSLAASAELSILGIYGQGQLPMKGLKKTSRTYCKHSRHLSVGGECRTIYSRYLRPGTMTNEGAKRNVPHLLQAQQALVCWWSVSETLKCQNFLVKCFHEGMLEFDGPMGAVFQQIFDRFTEKWERGWGRGR